MAWWRRDPVPEDVRDQLVLEPSERLLAAGASTAGWVVASTRAVWLPGRYRLERIGWELIDNATWDRDEEVLRVVQTAPVGERPRQWTLRLDEARDLLLVVKERVRATLVTSRWVPIRGAAGATVVARRPPETDRLTWTVRLDPQLDLADPAVKADVDEAVRQVRRDLGA